MPRQPVFRCRVGCREAVEWALPGVQHRRAAVLFLSVAPVYCYCKSSLEMGYNSERQLHCSHKLINDSRHHVTYLLQKPLLAYPDDNDKGVQTEGITWFQTLVGPLLSNRNCKFNALRNIGFQSFLKDIFLNHAVSYNILLIPWMTFSGEVISPSNHPH